jgi:glycine/D-amino acid oxidase-like deaminating enzyme
MTTSFFGPIGDIETPAEDEIRVSRLERLGLGLRFLFSLRSQDFEAAGTYRDMRWGHRSWLMRRLLFLGWGLREMFDRVPRAAKCATFDGPISNTPMWLLDENPFANHPWTDPSAALPDEADVVVIGAGFTGGGAAYHWARRAPADRTMVVLEMDDPASGSSGRNEGLVVMGRYFKLVYDTVLKHLDATRSRIDAPDRKKLARQFARRYCEAAYYNADLVEQTIRENNFECGYARVGWVQCQDAESESALEASVRMAAEEGYADWVKISPGEVRDRSGLRSTSPAGFSKQAASWHPAKWVWCLFRKALESDAVKLFTRTRVTGIERTDEQYTVHTDRGDVRCKSVIFATESYTPKLLAKFSGSILPMQEQAASGNGGPAEAKPHVGISGIWWFCGRYGRRLIFGSGGAVVPDEEAGRNKPSRFLSRFVANQVLESYGPYQMRIGNEWSGTVGYTPDGYPIVGCIDGHGQYIVAGMSGSGSGVSFNGTRCICNRILGLTDEPDHYPEEYFAPSRLLSPDTHPWPEVEHE